MIKKEKLYDAFGELIYAIAMADGNIQDEELEALQKLLSNHPWAKEIYWSFDYEFNKHHTIQDSFDHAINICIENGPDPEYRYLLDVMTKVAEAFNGIVPQERKIIDDFKQTLLQQFEKDLRSHKLVIDEE
ncbi:MAG: TerB family tellurite resistance protein [Bacteroidetes bacterium]|nr:MAG: TerB family tellurite resistance protein [Bacteroidota bacterium]